MMYFRIEETGGGLNGDFGREAEHHAFETV